MPEFAPKATFKHYSRLPDDIVHVAEYRVGAVLDGYVVRFRTSDGGKETLPLTWCQSAANGTMAWRWRSFDAPAPLYHARHTLPEGRRVLLVEGEVKADAMQAYADEHWPGVWHVVSWVGGCNRWKFAAWGQLAGHRVVAWPDCDSKRVKLTRAERDACADAQAVLVAQALKPFKPANEQPGFEAMHGIAELLRAEHKAEVRILHIEKPGVWVDGFDCHDAIKDGWTALQFEMFLSTEHPLGVKPITRDGLVATGKEDGDGSTQDGRLPRWLEPFWDGAKGRWMVSRKLVIRALENDPNLVCVLGYSELAMTAEALRDWPWESGRAGALDDSTSLLLDRYLSDTYGLPSISLQAIEEAILSVAHANRFHPVRDWLHGLEEKPKQEGILNSWLLRVLGYHESGAIPQHLSDYLVLAGRYWVLGIINRVMRPGCKFDYCPVLEGKGGLRKSTMIETLIGSQWYSDTHFDLTRGREGQEQIQGIILYELSELSALAKAEFELTKAFISSKEDRYRVAYGRTVQKFPRQCVIAGTTNKREWLRDRTGNRRWWPIHVEKTIDTDWLEANRDAIFAEGMQAFREGARYTPSQQEEDFYFVPQQEQRMADTAVTSKLLEVLTRKPMPAGSGAIVNEQTMFVTLAQIIEALGVDSAKSTIGLETQVRDWLYSEGWTRAKKQVNGVRAWGLERPYKWPEGDNQSSGETRPWAPTTSNGGVSDSAAF